MRRKPFVPTAIKFMLIICALLLPLTMATAQVSPAEIANAQLRPIEQAYLSKLVNLNREIVKQQFPFKFAPNRFVGLDPKDQVSSDGRGLEFVNFHDRVVLKLTGNYNAAYNAELLTANQRASRVFEEVFIPIIKLYPNYFTSSDDFPAFGFEVAYHVKTRQDGYEFEGKEILTIIIEKADLFNLLRAQDSERQEILNRAEIYLNGKDFGLALNAREPLRVGELAKKAGANNSHGASAKDTNARINTGLNSNANNIRPEVLNASTVVPATQADADRMQEKYQARLDEFAKEGLAKYHFVEYSPPSFVLFHKQVYLQFTIRNGMRFDKDSSIYRRAAQSFDLFLAPQLKSIIDKAPNDDNCAGVDITILNELPASGNEKANSEALEFICPLKILRQFVAAEITTQELINQSVVLVNGVRVGLNLQQVE
jgi:hypothetical protein